MPLFTGGGKKMKTTAYTHFIVAASLALGMSHNGTAADEYVIDSARSYVQFTGSHFPAQRVKGEFGKFGGQISYDPTSVAQQSVKFAIDAESINTREESRDDQLRGSDFFDASHYPQISFQSTGVSDVGTTKYVAGRLTLHGTTREITVPIEMSEVVTPSGSHSLVASGMMQVSRRDFGVGSGLANLIISDQVTVQFNFTARKN